MRTCNLSEAKTTLGRLADEALRGHPTVITRGGRLLILQAYEPPDADSFDSLISEGVASEHEKIDKAFWEGVRQRGTKIARKLAK